MSNLNFDLGVYPNDPASQIVYFNQIKQLLINLDTQVNALTSDVVELAQSTEPTQGEWETAWTVQTGKSLPISKNASLYWWSTVTDTLGGCYGMLLDSATVLRKDSKYSRGGIGYFGSSYTSDLVQSSSPIGAQNSPHPSLTFELNQVMDLELTYQLYFIKVGGVAANKVGADFLLDNVKVGSDIYSIATDDGVVSSTDSGLLLATAVVTGVSAGAHTVQAIYGYVGGVAQQSDHGGDYGIRLLVVKGYIL